MLTDLSSDAPVDDACFLEGGFVEAVLAIDDDPDSVLFHERWREVFLEFGVIGRENEYIGFPEKRFERCA